MRKELNEKEFMKLSNTERLEYIMSNWVDLAVKTHNTEVKTYIKTIEPFTANLLELNKLVGLLIEGNILNVDLYASMAVMCARISENLLSEKYKDVLKEDSEESTKKEETIKESKKEEPAKVEIKPTNKK